MPEAIVRSAVDGLPIRPTGEWAREKLYYLARYMTIFNGGMRYHWPRRVYVDLMAGPGRCVSRETGDEFDGSPLLALRAEPPFERTLFIEADVDMAAALETRTAADSGRRQVLPADCNSATAIAAIRATVEPHVVLGLAFVDMLGFEVAFDTIRAISENRNVDLVFTFHVGDLNRNLADALTSAEEGRRLDRFFGSAQWRDVVRRFDLGESGRSDCATALADFYGSQLHTLGYTTLEQLHRLMRNTRNAPLYRVLLASRHSTAGEYFRKIALIEYSGQRGFRFDG